MWSIYYIGKTSDKKVAELCEDYLKRINHFLKCTDTCLESAKHTEPTKIKTMEAEKLLAKVSATDFLILLDENGKEFTSVELSQNLSKWAEANRNIVFVIGGAYGFSDRVYQRANAKIALSKLTFPHQLARLVLYEQLYRALSIQKNLPYHHV